MAARDHTVRLEHGTYNTLETEAGRREVGPDELADELLRESLAETRGVGTADRTRAALAGLAAIRAQVRGPVDAVALVQEGRDQLERRSDRWRSS